MGYLVTALAHDRWGRALVLACEALDADVCAVRVTATPPTLPPISGGASEPSRGRTDASWTLKARPTAPRRMPPLADGQSYSHIDD